MVILVSVEARKQRINKIMELVEKLGKDTEDNWVTMKALEDEALAEIGMRARLFYEYVEILVNANRLEYDNPSAVDTRKIRKVK